MKKFILSSLVLMAAATAGVQAQTEVTPYTPGVTAEGITYFLPHTRLHITVTATKTTHTPGEYARFAQRYLRLADVTTAPYDEWSLTSVELTPYGVPDKTQAYTIKLKSKTSAPLVGLSRDGVLLSVNTEAPEVPELPGPSVERDKTARKFNPADYKTEEILSAGSTTKMAELTANEIYDIRESRTALIKGEADNMPKDGAQLKIMLDQLALQEQALSQLFKNNPFFSPIRFPTESFIL